LCRRNPSPHWKNAKKDVPVCLYVGSSKNIKQRLKEHLFLCNKNSYAMDLDQWIKAKNATITIYIWDFSNFLNSVKNKKLEDEYLQNIEDLLWKKYLPLFGRQGKK